MQQKIKFENLDPDLASRLQFPPCGAYAPCWEPLLYTQVGFQRASWNLPKLKGLTRQASFETVKRKQTEHLTFTEWSSIWYWRREGPFKWHTHYGSFRYFEKEVAPCGLNVFQHSPLILKRKLLPVDWMFSNISPLILKRKLLPVDWMFSNISPLIRT